MAHNKKLATIMSCACCGSVFEDRSSGVPRKYCSPKCRARARADNVKAHRTETNARMHSWYHERGGKQKVAERNSRPEIVEYRRLQVRLYKARHPDKVAEWTTGYREQRNRRVVAQSDGTAGHMIAVLMKLPTCQYCGYKFNSKAEKRIDHRDPIALGGAHSAVNLEVCCEKCNLAKAAKPFTEWISTLPQPFKEKAIARAEKARGSTLHQHALPLFVQPKR